MVCPECNGSHVIREVLPVFADGNYSDIEVIEYECPYCDRMPVDLGGRPEHWDFEAEILGDLLAA